MKTPQQLIKRERYVRLTSVFLIVGMSFYIMIAIDNLLASFVIAFASTYLLSPASRRLEQLGFKHDLAVVIPFVALLALMTFLGIVFIPLFIDQILELKEELPKYTEGLSLLITKWEKQVKEIFPFIYKYNLGEQIGIAGETTVTKILQAAPRLAQQLFTVTLLAPLLTFFMLKDGRKISRSLMALMPNNFYEMSLGLSHKINQQLGEFVRARLIEAFIVGLVVWIGLTILGFPYALFLAFFATLMNLIPYVGPFIGAIPAFIIAIINQEPSINVLLMSMVYFIAQLIDIVFVIPILVAKTVNLHPVTVIVVFIIGADLMGVLGMIISVPIASVLKLVLSSVYEQLIKFRA